MAGQSEAAYRALSALAAALTVPLIGWLGYRLAGQAVGLIAVTLAAFHPLHIYYAHEARSYALWILLLTATAFLLIESARRARWRWWIAYTLALLLTLPTHYFTIYWIPGSLACIVLARDRRRVLRQWLVANLAAGLLFAPYFFVAVLPAGGSGGSEWIGRSWEAVSAIPRTVWALLPAGGYPAHLRGLSLASPDTVPLAPNLDVVARFIPIVLMVAGALLLWRRRKAGANPNAVAQVSDESPQRPMIFVVSLTLCPLVLSWLYSLCVRPNYFVGRYDVVAWPGFILLMSLCISATPRRIAGALGWVASSGTQRRIGLTITLLLVGCSALPIARFLTWRPPPSPHRLRAEQLARLTHKGDLVLTFSYDREYLLYYLRRAGFEGRLLSFPSWLDGQGGWLNDDQDLSDASRLSRDARERIDLVSSHLKNGGQVWWVKDSGPPSRRNEVNRHFEEALQSQGFTLEPASATWRIWQLQPPKPK
ncbi:MAG: glycosyltransferase family 39 protein [Planctomycetes bacterium]|nr:glycosyltransferase family 39 protein [Planctomycetota bacterium]